LGDATPAADDSGAELEAGAEEVAELPEDAAGEATLEVEDFGAAVLLSSFLLHATSVMSAVRPIAATARGRRRAGDHPAVRLTGVSMLLLE
jgi:hypothetical protein